MGARIKEAREIQGLDQEALATRMATDPSLVSKWELGKVKPRQKTIQKLADALGVRSVWLICGLGPMKGDFLAATPTGNSIKTPYFADPWNLLEEVIASRGMKLTDDERFKIVIIASSKAILEKRDPTKKDVLEALGIVLGME